MYGRVGVSVASSWEISAWSCEESHSYSRGPYEAGDAGNVECVLQKTTGRKQNQSRRETLRDSTNRDRITRLPNPWELNFLSLCGPDAAKHEAIGFVVCLPRFIPPLLFSPPFSYRLTRLSFSLPLYVRSIELVGVFSFYKISVQNCLKNLNL